MYCPSICPLLSIVACLLAVLSFHEAEGSHRIFSELQDRHAVDVKQVHRTGYHFQPPKHWINDPNGPMYFKGLYHLFYQYNPKGAVWGNIVWAHSVSKDLISWQSLPPAIYPSKPFDINGCWSGSATVLPGDKPVILYTGIDPNNRQVQNYAVPKNLSDPYLREWEKPDDNPIVDPDSSVNASAFRDPTTAWFVDGHWKMAIGSKWNTKGMAHLYRSKDFKKWKKSHRPLHSKGDSGMWECPDFFPVSTTSKQGLDASALGSEVKHVFKVSLDLTRFEYYTIGTYDKVRDKYIPDKTAVDSWAGLRYDYGNFYASKSFYDPSKERRVLWGWANESDWTVTPNNDIKKGWAGIQLIPREIWLDKGGKQLVQWPVKELEHLRGNEVLLSKVALHQGGKVEVKGITAAQADVDLTFSFTSLDKAEKFDPKWNNENAINLCGQTGADAAGGLGPFGLMTLASETLDEYTPVFFKIYKAGTGKGYKVLMCSDGKSSSLAKDMYKPSFAGFVDLSLADKKISLRSLIDNSVVESYGAGGRIVISSRVYPTKAVYDDAHLFVFNNGHEPVTVDRLSAWSMKKPQYMNKPVVE